MTAVVFAAAVGHNKLPRLVLLQDSCSGVTGLTFFRRMKQSRRDLDCEDSTSSGRSNW